MKTVAKGVVDAKMRVQSLLAPNLTHTRAVPSLRGFLLWNTKEDFCLNGPLLSSTFAFHTKGPQFIPGEFLPLP
jgi:hypothetical protein